MATSDASILAPLAGFYAAAGRVLPLIEKVDSEDVPHPLRDLLNAPSPLTPRLEEYLGESLALRVLERRRVGDLYARRVVLVRGSGVSIVLGAIEIDLSLLPAPLRARVLAERVAFGHLVTTAVARPDALLRVACDAFIREALAMPKRDVWLFGRRRTLVNGRGAKVATIIEILAPDFPAPFSRTGA